MSGRAAPPPGDLSKRVAAVLRARKGELQVTDQQIGDAVGVSQEQVSRFLKPNRIMTLEQTAAICEYLGLDPSAALKGRRELVVPRSSDGVRPGLGADVRTLIEWMLAHPEDDGELVTRLDEITHQVDVRGARLAGLMDTIRTVRREELEQALEALPPHPPAEGRAEQSG